MKLKLDDSGANDGGLIQFPKITPNSVLVANADANVTVIVFDEVVKARAPPVKLVQVIDEIDIY